MINTWIRPKEWPVAVESPVPCQTPSEVAHNERVPTNAFPTLPPLPHPSAPFPEESGNNGKGETSVGGKRFQMKISATSAMTKTTGLSALPGI